jgi:hypothetical protein
LKNFIDLRVYGTGQDNLKSVWHNLRSAWHNLRTFESNRMKNGNLKSMSVDELWELHEFVAAELSRKMRAEQATLENRLRQLGGAIGDGGL